MGLFGPKAPPPIIPVNPADTANRQNQSIVDRLQSQGYNADVIPGGGSAPVGMPRLATLSGLSN